MSAFRNGWFVGGSCFCVLFISKQAFYKTCEKKKINLEIALSALGNDNQNGSGFTGTKNLYLMEKFHV